MSPGPRKRVVLSDAERTRLRQIEQRLVQQDPDYVRDLRHTTALLPSEPVRPVEARPFLEGAWWVAAALALLLAGGSVAGALVMCALGLAARACCAAREAVAVRTPQRRGRRSAGRRGVEHEHRRLRRGRGGARSGDRGAVRAEHPAVAAGLGRRLIGCAPAEPSDGCCWRQPPQGSRRRR
jgi:hypothetical protein